MSKKCETEGTEKTCEPVSVVLSFALAFRLISKFIQA